MRYLSAFGVLAAAAATANAQAGTTIQVNVGQDGLTYTPNNITAKVGTAIEFSFFPKVCLCFSFQPQPS
jgi:plastocyanin